MRRTLQYLILPTCKLLGLALAVNVITCLFVAIASDASYAFRVFLDLSLFESGAMMIVGPSLLLRSPTTIEGWGSKILLTGVLLFTLGLLLGLVTG